MTDNQSAIIEKIRKLLRLGRSNHQAEAEAAIAKAHELAQGAGIAIEGIDADREPARITHERSGVKARTHARVLCHSILKQHFSVWVIGCSDGGLYVGPAVNIAIARHVEEYLLRECSAAWTKHAKEQRIRKPRTMSDRRRVFERMFFRGIGSVLDARPARNDLDETAQAIERYTAEHFKVKSAPVASPKRCNGADYMGGLLAGENTRVDRPVEAATARAALPK
jgi:Protein of unknown function (DUF2786).